MQIIIFFAFFTAKLLVASGGGGAIRNGIHSEVIAIGTEHITPEYTTCQELPRANYEVLGGTGGFIHDADEVLFCGGTNMYRNEIFKECWFLNKDTTINMYYARKDASGIVIDNKVINLISFFNYYGNFLNHSQIA